MSKEKKSTDIADTGHLWDQNLRELTNAPPRWWMISLYASVLFLVVYFILYPAFPLVSGFTTGVLGWTQIKEYKADLEVIEKIRQPFEKKIAAMGAADILADAQLSKYTVRSAKVLFGERCAPCHGVGGSGNPGYPVLADDDWLYGGGIDKIVETIRNGRRGGMPGFASMMSKEEIGELAKHVMAMSRGQSHGPGESLFQKKGCTGCHGADGKGLQMMGSANLTDAIWRFSPGNLQSVAYTIAHGINNPGDKKSRIAIMPAFGGQLSDTQIKKLAVYVHKLGGGK